MEKKNNDATTSTYNTLKKMRGDWGDVRPVPHIIESKKNKQGKHKKREMERLMDEDYQCSKRVVLPFC